MRNYSLEFQGLWHKINEPQTTTTTKMTDTLSKIQLKSAKELREFLSLDKVGFARFVKKNNITKYPLNERVSRYDLNEIMQALASNRQRMQERQQERQQETAAQMEAMRAARQAGHIEAMA